MASMHHPIEAYRTFVFDCDGVLLDSNRVKTEAFYQAALIYGEDAASQLVAHHRANGGVSRQVKFQHLLQNIVGQESIVETEYQELLERYARFATEGLARCSVAEGALDLLRELPEEALRFVVSGGLEEEVRWILEKKGLAQYFHGIYGNPKDKPDLLARAKHEHGWYAPALYVGDARYDHEVAMGEGMDFLFVSGYSEFDQWPAYCVEHDLTTVDSLVELVR